MIYSSDGSLRKCPAPDNPWVDPIRDFFAGIVGMFPYVGSAVSSLTHIIWPDNSEEIWRAVADQTECLVEARLLQKEIHDSSEEIHILEENMRMYVEYKGEEKRFKLHTLINNSHSLMHKLMHSEHGHHVTPLAVVACTMHLTFLRERRIFGVALGMDDNEGVWEEELGHFIEEYGKYFRSMVQPWIIWREGLIEKKWGADHEWKIGAKTWGKLKDSLTGLSISLEDSFNSDKHFYQDTIESAYKMLINATTSEISQTLHPIDYIKRFKDRDDYGHKSPPDRIVEVSNLGIYCPTHLGFGIERTQTLLHRRYKVPYDYHTKVQMIDTIKVYKEKKGGAWFVAGIKFDDYLVGAETSLATKYRAEPGSHFNGLRLTYDRSDRKRLRDLSVHCADRREIPPVLVPQGAIIVDAIASPGHEIVGVEYKPDETSPYMLGLIFERAEYLYRGQ